MARRKKLGDQIGISLVALILIGAMLGGCAGATTSPQSAFQTTMVATGNMLSSTRAGFVGASQVVRQLCQSAQLEPPKCVAWDMFKKQFDARFQQAGNAWLAASTIQDLTKIQDTLTLLTSDMRGTVAALGVKIPDAK